MCLVRVVGEIPAAVEKLTQLLNLQLRVAAVVLDEETLCAHFVVEGQNWVNRPVRAECGLSYIQSVDATRFVFSVPPDSMSAQTAFGGRLLFDHLVDQTTESAAMAILTHAYGRKLPEQS